MSIDAELQPAITCPYCGYTFVDSWDYSDGGEVDCLNEVCEKPFVFHRDVEVTYTTSKIEDII